MRGITYDERNDEVCLTVLREGRIRLVGLGIHLRFFALFFTSFISVIDNQECREISQKAYLTSG